MSKLVRESDLFSPGKLGKSQGKWILQSSRNHGYLTVDGMLGTGNMSDSV